MHQTCPHAHHSLHQTHPNLISNSNPEVLEGPLEKKAGINYGPPGTKQLIYFVDDLNMPKLDPYETAMPISLIRQHLGWGHWWVQSQRAGGMAYVVPGEVLLADRTMHGIVGGM